MGATAECRDCIGFTDDESLDRFFCQRNSGHEGRHKWEGISDRLTNKRTLIEWENYVEGSKGFISSQKV